MAISFILELFAVSLGASALGGMLGMASGIFIVPALILFGVNIHTAVAASLVSVIACSCGSAAPFLREGLTNIRLAIVLEVATTLGALSGVLLSGLLPVKYLFALFAAILLLSAWQMLQRRGDPVTARVTTAGRWAALDSSYPDRGLGRNIAYRVDRLPLGMTLMYGAGLVSALLGIGSGVLKIPAMDTALRLPIKVSSATSNFMIGVTAAASAGAYFARGDIAATIAGPVALGSVAGAALGARILLRVSNEKLRLLFVILLVVLAAQMLLSAFGIDLVKGDGMNGETLPPRVDLERHLAQLLGHGTWAGSAIVGLGLILPAFGNAHLGNLLLLAGIGLFIALPVLRVILMLGYFLRSGDWRFAVVSALVLAIILVGIAVGLWIRR